jgi:hypothetical protein
MRRALVAITALACAVLGSSTAFADATPLQLVLLYMPNVSNTDTPSASGIAELVMQEGEVRLSAAGLPRLEGAERYAAWLINSQTNQFYLLGSFNTAEGSDAVHFEDVLLDAIPNRQWNLLLVTVETSLEPARPSNKHSIAGTFPRSERDPAPNLLPNTGGAADLDVFSARPSQLDQSNWLPLAGLAALLALVSGGAGYALGTKR